MELNVSNSTKLHASVNIKAETHEGFCSRSMLQAHFARVSTHEGAFSSSLNLHWELAPEDEVYP